MSSNPFGDFACDAGALEELLRNTALTCPCCNGPLTADKLARLIDDVQRLAQAQAKTGTGPAPTPAQPGRTAPASSSIRTPT